MFQIDNSSVVAQQPTPSAAGTPGFFTDGDPATGLPATILPAEFMNMLMMELMNIVDAAGVTPDKTKYNQVLSALDVRYALQSAFANSKATNGYQKLQGGLILQWGYALNITGNAQSTINFPISFPNAVVNIGVQDTGNSTTIFGQWKVLSQTLANFTVYGKTTDSNSVYSFFYWALGY